MIETLRKIRAVLDRRERRNALLLLGMMIVMGLLEAAGVASVMPFIALVSDPAALDQSRVLRTLHDGLAFSSTDDFLLFVGAAVFVLVVGSLAFKALTQWAMARFVQMRGYSLSHRLLNSYLARPYSFFLNRHSADLGKSVLSEVQLVVTGVLMPAAQLIANVILAAFLFAVVVSAGAKVAFSAVGLLGGAYVLIYVVVRKYLIRLGAERVRSNRLRFQVAQDALGGIKDVKVLGLEDGYLRSFKKPAQRYARSQAIHQIVSQLPQYILQAIAIGGLILFILVMLARKSADITELLPVLALYAFAGVRLLPALQQVYQAMTKLRYGRPALDALHADLSGFDTVRVSRDRASASAGSEPIRLRESLQLQSVSYTFPQAERPSLRDLSLTIPARTTVAFVGPTGAGKTTVVDLILGLLEPQAGSLLVDGVAIDDSNVRSWRRRVGYVPQNIFLTDDTIAANIAFGVPPEDMDRSAVERVARTAELHDFIVRETPSGYDTPVGERGVRLSGGQCQRIGIARALYHDPDVLVLDEATSALDSVTEKSVMEAVHNMGHVKTVIIIAHRLSTVRACDIIFLIEDGRLKAFGDYASLMRSNSGFRALAQA